MPQWINDNDDVAGLQPVECELVEHAAQIL